MIRNFLFFVLMLTPFLSTAQEKKVDMKGKLKAIANGYYLAYNEHNVDNILRFYADTAVLIDVNLNHQVSGHDEFRRIAEDAFYGQSKVYKNMRFEVYGMQQDGYKLTVKGEMQGIQWNEGYLENWPFVSHIYFNEKGRIIKQEDHIEYPKQVKKEVLLYTGKSRKN